MSSHMVHIDQTIKDLIDAIDVQNTKVGKLIEDVHRERQETFVMLNSLQLIIKDREDAIDAENKIEAEEREEVENHPIYKSLKELESGILVMPNRNHNIDKEMVRCTGCPDIVSYQETEDGLCHKCRMAREIEAAEMFFGEDR